MSPKAICICTSLVIVLAVSIGLLAASFKKLQSYEVGIVYNKITRRLHKVPMTEGLHIGPPGFEFIVFQNVYQTMTFSNIQCLNFNGVRIVLDVTCQYKVQIVHMKEVIKEFHDLDGFKKILKTSGIAAVHETCSTYTTAQFQEKREDFQQNVMKSIEKRFHHIHADVSGVQVNNIQRPKAYEKAIRDKERAREDILVAEQERPKKITGAETKMKESKTTSIIILSKANSNARIKMKQADAEAASLTVQYLKEAESYKRILDPKGLGYTKDGFLSYMAIRAVSQAKNPLYVGMNLPQNP